MAFLEEIDPVRVISFHQPLNGVDTDTKDPRFARRLARALRLPRTVARLRRALPRHDDGVVQPPLRAAPRSRSSTARARPATGWSSRPRASSSASSARTATSRG